MKNKTFLIALAISFSMIQTAPTVFAEEISLTNTESNPEIEVINTTSVEKTSTNTDVATTISEEAVVEIEEVVVDAEETETQITKVPSPFGLFWTDLRDSLRLAFTFNEIDKANLELQIAEEKMKMAEYVAQNVTDEAQAEKIISKLTKKADKLYNNLEKKQEKILKSKDERKEDLVEDVVEKQERNTIRLENLEGKMPEEKLNQLKTRIEERNKNIQEKALNSDISEDKKESLKNRPTKEEIKEKIKIENSNKKEIIKEKSSNGKNKNK